MAEQSTDTTSARTETVKSYVSPSTKQDLDREADRLGLSRSALIARYCRRGLRQDREEDLAADTEAARRLGDVLDAGIDDMEDVARQIQDLNAKTGVYAVAAFELVKREHGEAAVRKALQTGARRLREQESPAPVDDVDHEETPTESTSSTSSGNSVLDRIDRG